MLFYEFYHAQIKLCYVRLILVFHLVHFSGYLLCPCHMLYSCDLNMARILIYNLEGIGGKLQCCHNTASLLQPGQ